MSGYHLLELAPLLAMLSWAAGEDWRSRRIPNWLCFSLVLSGLALSATTGHGLGPGQALLGALLGFVLLFAMLLLNAVGGGDVKLMAGVGAWLGPLLVLKVFAAAAVVGLLIVVVQGLWRGRLPALLRNSAVIALNLVQARQSGLPDALEHMPHTAIERPLPYAVSVLIGCLVVVSLGQ